MVERSIVVLGILLNAALAAALPCADDTQCPPSAPKCNVGSGTCEATCDSNGGDLFCSARFGSAPGNDRFCETDNGQGKLGQCVACLSPDNTACPLAAPVCNSADACAQCTVATASACANHGSYVCSPSDTGGSGACVQCLTAANCTGTSGCVANSCTACNGDASCTGSASGPRCVAGACVQCANAADCSGAQGCVGGVCGACNGDASCTGSGAGASCVGGACVQCRDASGCSAGQGCVNHVCMPCTADADCSGSTVGPFCVTGSCVACRNAGDCAGGQGCVAHVCGSCAGSDANCAGSSAGPKCNGATCVQCLANTDCVAAANPQCTNNVCVACTGNAGCIGHAQPNCETAATANQGRCVQCRSSNASADCSTNAAPQCTVNVCGACSGASGEVACHDNHGGRHCEDNNTPPSLNGQCVICRGERSFAQTDCNAAAPLCNATIDACGPCDTDGNSDCVKFGATAVCDNPSSGGTGACLGCVSDADCADPAQPHCVSKICTGCDSTTAMHGDESCSHFGAGAAVAACQPNDGIATGPGECRQCSRFNSSLCTGATPACNVVTGGCQLCTVASGDMGAQASGCTTDPNGSECEGSGTSVFCGCDSDADCGAVTSGRTCDGTTHLCKDGCSRAVGRNGCPAGQFCSSDDTTGNVTGVCTMSCQYDADCASMPKMPFCIGVMRDDGGVGTMGRCAACRNDADCSGGACDATGVCTPPPDMAMSLPDAGDSDLSIPGDLAPMNVGGGGGCGGCSAGGSSDVSLGVLLLLAFAIHLRRRRAR